jgi:hypothetical protein
VTGCSGKVTRTIDGIKRAISRQLANEEQGTQGRESNYLQYIHHHLTAAHRDSLWLYRLTPSFQNQLKKKEKEKRKERCKQPNPNKHQRPSMSCD